MTTIQEFDYSANLLRVIPWQYENAERLIGWLQNKQDNFDLNSDQFWSDWYTNVFNLDTANEFGISIWSKILDVPLFIGEGEPPGSNWGFGPFRKNYNNGNFSSNDQAQNLTTDQKRRILKVRYIQLISRATIPDINFAMNAGWGDIVSSYCLDNENMSITYFFESTPPPWILYAINTLQILPRPSAVSFSVGQ